MPDPLSNILVIGGTRYFGAHLVRQLLAQGHRVTIATRGQADDDFGPRVQRLRIDRKDTETLRKALGDSRFEVVYDQICNQPSEALAATALFRNRAGLVVMTSTQSVYGPGAKLRETHFNPKAVKVSEVDCANYAEGKRQVEGAYFQQASFPLIAVRFPIVLGPDDYTKRLRFHVERVIRGQPIIIANPEAQISFIHSEEAGQFLAWVPQSALRGPVNACSDGQITIGEFIRTIEEVVARKAHLIVHRSPPASPDLSPFAISESWAMDTRLARKAGFAFRNLSDWLPPLIAQIAADITGRL